MKNHEKNTIMKQKNIFNFYKKSDGLLKFNFCRIDEKFRERLESRKKTSMKFSSKSKQKNIFVENSEIGPE